MNNSRLTPLSQPDFILVTLFSSPDSAAYARYYAALIAGNDLYGEVVLLKEKEIFDESECFIPLNKPTVFVEWEWFVNSLSAEETKMTSDLYDKYMEGVNNGIS